MGYIAQEKDYWIHPSALTITLNALGNPNRTLGSVSSGAVIMCFIRHADQADSLGYNASHGYKSWRLQAVPTYFNSNGEKYVYVAIPRTNTSNTQALVVFPGEILDIDGKNSAGVQVGSQEYFYIYLQGKITATDGTSARQWSPTFKTGKLDTAEGIDDARNRSEWFVWNAVMQVVSFIRRITMDSTSWFENLRLGDANHNLTGVATAGTDDTFVDSDELVVTPSYIKENYLSRNREDTAEKKITFKEGIKITGSDGTLLNPDDVTDTAKRIGLDVDNSGIVGGIFRVARSILTKTVQSLNFSEGDSLTGTGWQLTDDDGQGRSRLVVDDAIFRGKVTISELIVRQLTAMSGNYVFSPAASIIEQVDYYNNNNALLGYTRVKVPWVLRLIPLSLRGRYLAKMKWIRSTMSEEDFASVKFYRCWLRADDGSTRTINTWRVGMLARCQTFDTAQIDHGTHDGTYSEAGEEWSKNVTNKLYWRAVVSVAEGIDKEHYNGQTVALDDGRKHNYIDIANYSVDGVQLYLTGSDHVSAGDHIVCFGDWLEPAYSNLISIETVGDAAPALRELLKVGYTDGNDIDWSLAGKELTRISPIAGNKFVAPEFIVRTYDGEGRVVDENIATSLSELKLIAGEITSRVTRMERGRNLITITDGWEGYDGSEVSYDVPNFGIFDENSDLYSPAVKLADSDVYCFSAYLTESVGQQSSGDSSLWSLCAGNQYTHLSDLYHQGTHLPITLKRMTGESLLVDGVRYYRYYYTVKAGASLVDLYVCVNYASSDKILCPQVEILGDDNTYPTKFSAESIEVFSQVKQTADRIKATICSELGETGVDITRGKIQLIANKTEFVTSEKKPMIAVQMCNANGDVGTGPSYNIPSVVFYDNEIGNGGQIAWVLNYLGFIQAVNTGRRYKWEVHNEYLIITPEEGRADDLGRTGIGVDEVLYATLVAYSDISKIGHYYYETFYQFTSGYTITNGVKQYVPANGQDYEGIMWLTNNLTQDFRPDYNTNSDGSRTEESTNAPANGYYLYIKERIARNTQASSQNTSSTGEASAPGQVTVKYGLVNISDGYLEDTGIVLKLYYEYEQRLGNVTYAKFQIEGNEYSQITLQELINMYQ